MKAKLLVLVALMQSNFSFADIAIVVHPTNANSLDTSDIARIYLGKSKRFPDGSQAEPLNQDGSLVASDEFNNKVLNKSSSQLKAYWSKLVFTGKGQPPKSVLNDEEVIQLVAENPTMMGYVAASSVNETVKVITRL